MAKDGWEFWRVTRAADDELEWLAVTRPSARSVIDRRKFWTLVPATSVFVANWFVTEDYWREDDGSVWGYENIDADEARMVALGVPDAAASDMSRLARPESSFTLNQIDRHPVEKLLGKRVAEELAARARRDRSASGK
ncbi:hypothetical protein [Nocardia aurea]|uniref:DUF402 domain-containing protein n=1 Tax=Nocardia aurea TaxID=2144174 RepID=A0ABV3FM10_9NOCA